MSGTSGTGVTDDHRKYVGSRDVTDWKTRAGRRLASRHKAIGDRFGHGRTLVATLAIGGALAAAASFAAAQIYDGVTDRNGLEALDGPALKLAKGLRSPVTDGAAASIARVFGPVGMPLLTVSAAAVLSTRQRKFTPATLLVAAGVGSLAMTLAGKHIIHRHRPHRRDAIPPFEKSPSFPSGHTLNATTIVGTLAYLLALEQKKNLPQVLTIGAAGGTAITVGLSRVLLGAHWFTDVAVGWTTGAGWLALIVTSHRLYLTNRR